MAGGRSSPPCLLPTSSVFQELPQPFRAPPAAQEEWEPEPEAGGENQSEVQHFSRRGKATGKEQAKGDQHPNPQLLAISNAGSTSGHEEYFPSLFWAKSPPRQRCSAAPEGLHSDTQRRAPRAVPITAGHRARARMELTGTPRWRRQGQPHRGARSRTLPSVVSVGAGQLT